MSKFFINKIALPVAIMILGIGSANAALNCNVQPSCTELGYSVSDVEGCENYVRCPFDKTFKACVKVASTEVPVDCTGFNYDTCPDTARRCTACGTGTNVKYKITMCNEGYTLTSDGACVASTCDNYNLSSCPDTAQSCDICISGVTTKYKITSCKEGYTATSLVDPENGSFISNCIPSSCTDYTLSSCPQGGVCTTCKSGETTKYKLNSCQGGYVVNGNGCYDCYGMQQKLNKAFGSRGYYLYCDNRSCETDATDCSGSIGSRVWNNACICNLIGSINCIASIEPSIPEIIQPSEPGNPTSFSCKKTDYNKCLAAEKEMDQLFTTHNSICPSQKVTKHSAYSWNCNLYIPDTGESFGAAANFCTSWK